MKEGYKEGYKTTEFWLSLAAVLVGAVQASGAFGEGDGAKILGVLAAALAAMGYTAARGFVKGSG